MKNSLQLINSQTLKVTPELQKAIKLLQLSMVELNNEIMDAIESNPMLELAELSHVSKEADNNKDANKYNQEKDFQSQEINIASNGVRSEIRNQNASTDIIEKTAFQEKSVEDHLFHQIKLINLQTTDIRIAEIIIYNLNSKGFLELSIDELCEAYDKQYSHKIFPIEANTVRNIIMRLDPVGFGAYTIQEYYLIQLSFIHSKDNSTKIAINIINNYFNDFLNSKFKKIKKSLNEKSKNIISAIKVLSKLKINPIDSYFINNTQYVTPDVIVSNIDGCLKTNLNNTSFTKIKMSNNYDKLNKKKLSEQDKVFFSDNIKDAKWFIRSLNHRNNTLLDVSREIINYQKDFLIKGDIAMKPLVMSYISTKLGLHESTVSRVINNKYILTPRGNFELKYFFSNSIKNLHGNNSSSKSIKATIADIITHENKYYPFNDNEISTILKKRDINISRRTVAKYRESINILSSYLRRKQYIKNKTINGE